MRASRISIAQLSATDTDGSLLFMQRFNPLCNLCNKIQTHNRFKRTLCIRSKYNMRIFGVIPFIKLQNDT